MLILNAQISLVDVGILASEHTFIITGTVLRAAFACLELLAYTDIFLIITVEVFALHRLLERNTARVRTVEWRWLSKRFE